MEDRGEEWKEDGVQKKRVEGRWSTEERIEENGVQKRGVKGRWSTEPELLNF
jgi:hypothetical protein